MSPYSNLGKELEYAHNKMRKWMERMSQQRLSSCFAARDCWIPSADIHETEEAYHIFVDLAGVDPSSIQLMVEGNSLRINGERQRPRVDACIRVHQLEIDSGPFERMLRFPVNLDTEGARSSYGNGFLEIVLPKRHRQAAVQISLRNE